MKFGVLIFPDAEELDFVGPWEVFTVSAMVRNKGVLPDGEVFTIAETPEAVRCAKGMRVIPDIQSITFLTLMCCWFPAVKARDMKLTMSA